LPPCNIAPSSCGLRLVYSIAATTTATSGC